ncbi:WD40 repeat domain-containing serine/threonine protein kinase [Nonomuraea jiangxiensis]|uniref:Serine/threonine protein kinase n=1 Tax=Nonomuraea jiangxiensis TaxID=633440 RepID=A0A1G8ZUK2_9ACTN|nr:serine/threonine-protein kinase [Nonomuraea jiangxiensis]SDK18677.1 Serine/threonine protein kinase [Nonomuraea jiangxiensis]
MRLVPGDPERLGGYWLAARLGAGGRGVVYDAYDDEGRRYAVTVPRGEVGRRFERVSCRHLADVVSVGIDEGVPYVVSEFVSGPDLRSAVDLHGPYAGDELVALANALAGALGVLHEAGLTHRGLNPESVLLAGDGPKVIELGLPAGSAVGGTYTYQSPEVVTGGEPGAAADVFAWGAVVLFAATGCDPFRGESLGGVMHRLLTVDPDLSVLPDVLREPVGRALAKDPADRPAAAELRVESAAELRPPEEYAGTRPLGEVAEEAYLALTPRQQEEVPGLLLRLLDGDNPDDEGDVLAPLMAAGLLVRRSVRVPPVETAVGKLVAVSDDRVAPASAALYRAWPRLRAWVADERDGLAVHRQIREAARHWSAHRRDRSHLFRGEVLDTALGWAATKRRHLRLNQLERDFLNDSVTLAKQRRKLLVPSLATLGAVLAVAVTMSVVSVHGQNDLRERLLSAEARAVAARAEAMRASDPRTAMRLSVAAWRLSPVFEARAALQASLVQPELGVFTDPAADLRARYLLRGDELVKWDDGGVTVWDVAGGRRLVSYPSPAGIMALSGDGRFAVGADGRPFEVATGRAPAGATYAIVNGNRTRVYRGEAVLFDVADRAVALSPDGSRAAFSRLDGRVELWDTATRTRTGVVEVRPPTGPDAAPPALAFSPDGTTLAVAGRDGITLIRANTPGPTRPRRTETPASATPNATHSSSGPSTDPNPSPRAPADAKATDPPRRALANPSATNRPSQAPADPNATDPPRRALANPNATAPPSQTPADPRTAGAPSPTPTGAAVERFAAEEESRSADGGTAQEAGRPETLATLVAPGTELSQTFAFAEPTPAPGTEALNPRQGGAEHEQRGSGREQADPAQRGAGREQADSEQRSPGREQADPGQRGAGREQVASGKNGAAGREQGGPPVFSPDGRLLALPGAGEVRVWNVAERRLSGSYPLKEPVHGGLVFSADGHSLRYLSGTGSVISLDVSGLPAPYEGGASVAFSGDGQVAARDVGSAIELIDTVARRTLGRIGATGAPALDATGRLLAVAGDPVTVWEVPSGRRVAAIRAGGDVPAVALSPRGDTLATTRGRTLETWDVRAGRRLKLYEGAGDLALAFGPDGSTLAAGAKVLDLASSGISPLGTAAPVAVAFSPDGGKLAYGLDDGRVVVWDVRRRTRLGTIETGLTPVDDLRFSPRGDLLAVGATRTSLWDASTLREVGRVGLGAAGLTFSQDSRRLRGVALDGSVREVPIDPALTVREVCAKAGGPLSRAEWTRLIPESGYRKVC